MHRTPTVSRRTVLRWSAAGASTALVALARAQRLPATLDTARIVLGSPPGSVLDTFARRVGEAIQSTYANSVIVENRTGASGQIAVTTVKAAPADGATILLTPMPMMGIFPHTYKRLPYDPVADFAPVSMGATFDLALAVGPGVPAGVKSLADFFAWCKANPAQAHVGSPAAGSTPHFVGSMAGRAAGVEISHVPYRGPTPAIVDMVGGQVSAACSTIGDFMPFLESGKARILATTGTARSRFTPAVATFKEQGFAEIVLDDWFGMFVPAKTPQAQVQRLNGALKGALSAPAVVRALEERGMDAGWSTPAALAARLQADLTRWSPVVKQLKFSAET